MACIIHPTAIVDPAAKLGVDVQIGPLCFVGPNVELGDRMVLKSHVSVDGRTKIGEETVIFPFASIGQDPQDLKYHGEPSELIVGARNKIREYVTMNPGTEGDQMTTWVGDDNLFMVGVHVAHDCRVGSKIVIANNVALAGHVHVGDCAVIGGLSGVHQFVKIGHHAMVGAMSMVAADVIPYGLVMGERAHLGGLNLVGLERRGFAKEDINTLRRAYRLLFTPEGTFAERLDEVSRSFSAHEGVQNIISFIRDESTRGLCMPKSVE
ncbi:MAG TPA: acyl-[acyl-carrier-protein]--UDP-N-acetylglucosamine O-acyltransferase [Rhodospirillaceae bacterium]|nr:MAG: acyl-[acyl-carrier-protein]--UDP-N-acetylglucosamine O-acyltransferase [Alphaproteobacteria bacterium GWF2_58_20]HAU28492.1 acyl-[acyl-carrier-protein]--UDP-N-acetylglucosamine O-acyltransferase [Rhodospirillaceae bacterium]